MDQYLITEPPSDGISQLVYSQTSDLLLATSWDMKVRLYDAKANALLHDYSHKAAVLACAFIDDDHAVSGGLDKVVKSYDFVKNAESILTTHESAISNIKYSPEHNLLFSGSWDRTVHSCDPRDATNSLQKTQLPDKVYSMDIHDETLIIATANRLVYIYDIRNMSEPQERRESSLRYQTRCISIFPNGLGYAMGSTEGRVAIEYFDQQKYSKFAFKCHRASEGDIELAYPVNTIAFHPIYGTFATGGCDGSISIWDGQSKKKIAQFNNYPTSISSLCFNHDGTQLAIASSYTFENGDIGHPTDQIYIKTVYDADVKPKVVN